MTTIKRFNQYFSHDSIVEFVSNSLLSISEGKEEDDSAQKVEEYKNEFQKIKDDL